MAKKRKVKAAKTQNASIKNTNHHTASSKHRRAKKASNEEPATVKAFIQRFKNSLLEYFLSGIIRDQKNNGARPQISDYILFIDSNDMFWSLANMRNTLEALYNTDFHGENEVRVMFLDYHGEGRFVSNDFPGVDLTICDEDTWKQVSYYVYDDEKHVVFNMGQTIYNLYIALEGKYNELNELT